MITPLPDSDLVLETERMRLTPMVKADTDVALAVLTDPEVMHFVADAMTPEDVVEHMDDAVKRGAGGRIGLWCITHKETGKKMGDAILMPVPIDEDDWDYSLVVPDRYPPGQIEIGYMFLKPYWGQGYATEACTRLLRFAFEQTELSEVVATTDPDNAKSQHVLQKCGLKPLGKKRAYGYDDVSWFEITRAEWEAGRSGPL